jgi:hypothetical protein
MYNCAFGSCIFYGGTEVFYSIHCNEHCQNCFGCCDIRGKRYCILNKQYTKDEYERLVPQIIESMRHDGSEPAPNRTSEASSGSWGEFFPMDLSPFAYNESLAPDYFPLTKEECKKRGLLWKEKDDRDYLPATITLPDRIADATDAIVQETLACESCRKNYRITTKELSFYRTHNLPIPRHCPDCRCLDRIARRNPEHLWGLTCAKCQKPVATSYSPERPETVYCEGCYLSAIY